MKKIIFTLMCALMSAIVYGQSYNQMDTNGNISTRNENGRNNKKDSLGSDKEIPIGLKVWTIDSRFGDRIEALPDTMPNMYMNSIFTTGMRGEYNTLGNLGSPRINRIFIDRPLASQFIFTDPYDFFLTPIDKFQFTNTLSPITNISYDECGNKTNGEDHLKALFAVNANKRLGLGFKFDYIYGRGYYSNQSTSHFNASLYASYLGDRYDMHFLFSTNHEKVAENGGITDDNYITHPESFSEKFSSDEIPTILSENWNRNDNHHIFLTHRYNIGFNRKVKMTEDEIKAKKFGMASKKENDALKEKEKEAKKHKKDIKDMDDKDMPKTFGGRPDNAKIAGNEPIDSIHKGERITVKSKAEADSLIAAAKKSAEDTAWLKNEYVPVTSFIHTLDFNYHSRIYEAYQSPTNYYTNTYFTDGVLAGDSIYDKTKYYNIKNTFAIALLEGFNKYAKAGLKIFGTHEYRNFSMPDSTGIGRQSWSEHNISVGAQLNKTQGSMLHYNLMAETWLVGEDAGQLKLDGRADVNFHLFNDTVQLAAKAFFYRLNPTFFYRHYQSKHFWWDNDGLDKELRTHIEGDFSLKRTRTRLRVAVDNLQNYTYFSMAYTATSSSRTMNTVSVNQSSENISLITAQLNQDFTLGPLNWENQITYQKSTNGNILPVPDLNIYSNLYLRFMIAHVLKVDLGGDVRFFTKYYAPDYSAALGQYCIQTGNNQVEIGNCPIINVYANMHLKHTRFFLMMSHVAGGKDYFYAPHYPLNGQILRFGVSWNFFN